MATYELYLSSPLGVRLAVLDTFAKLDWTRAVNDVGGCVLTFGSEQADWRLFGVDRRLEVWRVLDTGLSRLVRVYLIRRIDRETTAQGRSTITISGVDANDLLARRIVAANAGAAAAEKTDQADDMIKAIAREQLGASAATGRTWTANGFTVAGDLGLGPSLTKSFSRRNVLAVCQDIALAAYDLGTAVYFDVVEDTLDSFQLRTYTGQRGADRTGQGTPFSLLRGTLTSAAVSQDWTAEQNYLYVAGQGVEADRTVVEVSDTSAIAASPWGRCEGLADGRSYTDSTSLTSYGRVALQKRKATRRFQALLADGPGSRFQLDWDFGDLLTAEYDEEQFTCHVAAVRGTVTPDSETIEARLDYAG